MIRVKNHRSLMLIGVFTGLIFAELDETVVSTAMPSMIRQLHGLAFYGWVPGIYMLAASMFMPILSKLADLYGRKRIYLFCMGLFILGSLISGMAPSIGVLLTGRGIQGIGAGGLMPIALAMIGDAYPLEQRARIQSLIGPFLILPQLLGPTVGGYFVEHVSWHWVFLINIPVGVIAATILSFGMRESRGSESRKIDWGGAATLILALLALLLTPVLVDHQGFTWSSPVIVGLLLLSALLIVGFVRIESKAKEPLIPLHLFRNRNIVVMSLLVFILMLGAMGSTSAFPLYAQNVMGLTPTEAGYLMLAFMAGVVPSSLLNGFLITRLPYRSIFIICFILPIISFFLLSKLGITTTVLYVIVTFFVLGIGFGALFGSDNLIVQESVDKEHSGIALGTVQLFQSLGTTIGLSVYGSMLARQIEDGVTGLADQLPADTVSQIASGGIPQDLNSDLLTQVQTVFVGAFQNIFTVSLWFTVAAFFLCWFLKKEVLSKKESESAM
ncbi:MDR family MFS transporter [Paenibacillus phocaensis]|uniref:MDR family MFS transporter n=1 Tax=Paenibacillus phocaensis TaxID=1776378 RepID=UPI0003A0D19D|nr:MDR family MFS transporter [Paenibacillus phocaensis]